MPQSTKGGLRPTRHAISPKPTPATILNVLAEIKNNVKSDYSTHFVDKALNYINKHTDLNQPEQVKAFIANLQTTTGYKKNLCLAYNKYAKHYKIQWKMPLYIPEAKTIKIPTREKIQMLIAHASRTLSLKLTLSMETGLRPIELCNLKVKDIDLDQNRIHPTTAKHGSARTLKISNNLQKTLKDHITEHKLNLNDKLFKGNAENYAKYYRTMRSQLAKKLNDPTFKNIRLYDFRHYFATMLYAKTRDILYVKQQMGHKKIETTLIYTQLLNLNDDEWTVKTATNVKEATEILEAGFEYIQDIDGIRIYRKRK
jgi:integrase